jgi:hypothetical protein
MNDGTPLGVRVQEAFMAAVLIGPTTRTLTLDPAPIVYDAEWVPESVWAGAEDLDPTPTRIRSLDRPVRSELLYRLSYP